MKKYALRCVLYAALVALVFSGSGCSEEKPMPVLDVNGKGAAIISAKTGEVLYRKNPEGRYPPASTAKVMTAIVAIENMPLEAEIIPGPKVVRVEPTIIGLKPGVKYKLGDLIKAILIKSANDAAFVIAEAVAGSEEKFARMMNEKALQIGMENTNFVKASGLPAGRPDAQHTTAIDLAKMMRYAQSYDAILEAMSMPTAEIYGSDGKRIFLKTHNRALLKSDNAPWGKTGYTREARRTFAGGDPSMEPVIAFGLLKSTDLWNDISTLKNEGLRLYEESRRTWWTELVAWIKAQRKRGREDLVVLEALRG
ncbi:MAG: hypothetical protein GF408_03260 [Candidatus Omnitrophica bacterium]|nr:hypothetical protein [Candidatus Omnitrophota bacterium]